MKLPIQIKLSIAIILAFIVILPLISTYEDGTKLYNKATSFRLENDALIQKQRTNYDGYYQAFMDKQANASINKEAFIEVTNIIMTNRKDGQNLAWKWNQENQQIPYEEFTSFYRELSAFISARYADNMEIERQKQDIVKQHNILISIYPNNLINKYFLHIDKLVYKEGYITEFTKTRFK